MAEGRAFGSLFGTTDMMVSMVLGDLTDEQARHRPRGEGGPSIAWTIAHLLHYRVSILRTLGEDRAFPFGEEFGNGTATDGEGYPSLDELRKTWQEVSDDFMPRVKELTGEALDVSPENGWGPDHTLRDQVAFLAWHESYHIGAVGQIRKAMGLPGPAELMMAQKVVDAES